MKTYRIDPHDTKPGCTHVMTLNGAELLEAEARRLRDQVYGTPISDKEWENCKQNWMRDIEWLRAQTKKG